MQSNSLKGKDWYLGLDIGTASVGWAVTDEQYHIPRLRGQRAWGVRLFEEAQAAADRRMHRTARRRYYRRAERLKYLRQIFAPYIVPIDSGFFERMADSFLWAEDKHESMPASPQKNSLFNDADYTDKDFFKDFPTIFHLRDYLMNPAASGMPAGWQPKKLDARHYYLALHNIIKYRGHFLFPGEAEINTANTSERFAELYERLQLALMDVCKFEFGTTYCTNAQTEEVQEISFAEVLLEQLSKKDGLTNKKNAVKDAPFNTDLGEDEQEELEGTVKLIAQFLVGSKTDFSKIAECEGKVEVQLGQAGTDDKIAEAVEKIGGQWQPILEVAQQLFDIGVARQIIQESPSLSTAYIKLYDEFAAELNLYNASKPKEKQLHELACPRTVTGENGREQEQTRIVKPKLRGYYKGAIPMQLHLGELKRIVASFIADQRYSGFATATTSFKNDPTGVPDQLKVAKLLTHKVPYYIGPLQTNQGEGKDAQTDRQKPWCKRLLGFEAAKIYPWNFDTVVDKATSATNFIQRMTNKCTYLSDQPCLPKDSILYQRYMILNELNKLRVGGVLIDVPTKQALFSELFMTKTDIRLSTIKGWFAAHGCNGEIALADAAGTGGTINHKMTSYLKFKALFGASTDSLLPQIEDAILAITVLPDDKEMLRERLATIFGTAANEDTINKIAGFNFSKWGNFSAKLLDGINAQVGGEQITMIEALWQQNYNFMELMGSGFGFAEQIKAYQGSHGYKSDEELISESYASVPVKRACRQAIKIVRELEQIIGTTPAKVFIETPRANEDSGRTQDRKRQLDGLYEKIKAGVADYQATKAELAGYEASDLKPKALYLYFLQNGRCAYSGESLDISTLSTDCDIDHIIPQAMIKDDSFDNLVLVKQALNRAKSDTYPLVGVPAINFNHMLLLWRSWHKNGLMSDKKFKSLSRTALTMDEIAGFINRQIVETSQTTKMVMDILKFILPDTEIVYQKAETVAEFKREWAQYEGTTVDGRFKPWLYIDGKRLEDAQGNPRFDPQGEKKQTKLIKPQFIKVRDMNDLHHAKDAYLNIVVGNVYSAMFTNNPRQWLREKYGDKPEAVKLSMRTVMYDDRKALPDGSRGEVKQVADRNGVIVWDKDCLATVIETYERNDILVTVRSFEKHGAIFDQNILSYEEGKIRFSIKRNMPTSKYGGYSGSYSTYFAYIMDSRGKKQFAAIPLRYAKNPMRYLNEAYPGCNVLLKRILFKSVLVVKGHPVTLDGSTGSSIACSNFKQLLLSFDDSKYLAKLLKTKDKMTADKKYVASETSDKICTAENNRFFQVLLSLARDSFSRRPNVGGVLDFLQEKEADFNELSLNDQVTLLINMLKMFQRVPFSSSGISCELLGGKKQTGTTSFSIYENDVKLVISSATGLYRNVVDLGAL